MPETEAGSRSPPQSLSGLKTTLVGWQEFSSHMMDFICDTMVGY
jgi:hypothetical protein